MRNGIDLPFLAAQKLHSMSLLVIRLFAEGVPDTYWRSAGKYFSPLLFNDTIADAVGAIKLQGIGDPKLSDVLRDAIAYSAVDITGPIEGKPFGDSRELY